MNLNSITLHFHCKHSFFLHTITIEGLAMKNYQNFLHLYDNNRLITLGLNKMLPGQPSPKIYVYKSKDG